jgi:hypothetical protein
MIRPRGDRGSTLIAIDHSAIELLTENRPARGGRLVLENDFRSKTKRITLASTRQ